MLNVISLFKDLNTNSMEFVVENARKTTFFFILLQTFPAVENAARALFRILQYCSSLMRKLEDWLTEYGVSHKNPTNKLIHWICVPSIVLSLVILLWSVPNVDFLANLGINWAYIVMMLAMMYYMFLSPALAVGMLLFFISISWLTEIIVESTAYPLWGIGLTIFSLAWIGQFYGHKIEGKKPSFLKDIQFLLIGPIWLLNFIYQKFGIKT